MTNLREVRHPVTCARGAAVAAAAFLTIILGLAAGPRCQAQTFTVLHSFTGSDGWAPWGSLIMDSAGNLYGTTQVDGPGGGGTVFELVKNGSTYTETTLYSFRGGSDGSRPYAGLIMDSAGNLFGTTFEGGAGGYGTAFELVNNNGTYTETVLHAFTGGSDGMSPWGSLIMDSSGNLFGTTFRGGSAECTNGVGSGCGTVFELAHNNGTYRENVIHSFTGQGGDGSTPIAGLIVDASGNLYGTTIYGGAFNAGTVFELARNDSTYTLAILYSFTGGADGALPEAALITDAAGNLYGTTLRGGGSDCLPGFGCGTVFELVRTDNTYTETTLHSLVKSAEGVPQGGLVMDASGNLYGTTASGGTFGYGTIFELVKSAGTYGETVLHNFTGGSDGAGPVGNPILDASGNLYGITSGGGAFNFGAVFRLSFAPAPIANLSANSLTFGNQAIGTTSAAQTVTVTNSGNANLVFGPGAVTVSGTNAAEFSLTSDGCSGQTIGRSAPGNTCSVGVVFTPSLAGIGSASLNFADNAGNTPQVVSLTGTGIANAPVASLTPPGLTFGLQLVGTTSLPQSATLSNTGNVALAISSIAVSGDFEQSNNCGASLAAGAKCAINVTFTPTTGGTRPGTLTVTDNSNGVAGSTQTVGLSGTGAGGALSLFPAKLSLGYQPVGTTGNAKQFAITNTYPVFGPAYTVISVTASGDFAASSSCVGAVISQGTSCRVSVTFTPTALGPRTGTVSVTATTNNSPQTVALTGVGVEPVTLWPPTAGGPEGWPRTFTLHNSTSTTVDSVVISTTGELAVASTTCGTSLAAMSTCAIVVSFTGGGFGAHGGTLVVSDSASNSPQVVKVSFFIH